jgi:hypothetical protein
MLYLPDRHICLWFTPPEDVTLCASSTQRSGDMGEREDVWRLLHIAPTTRESAGRPVAHVGQKA